jgi:hypothetical protein
MGMTEQEALKELECAVIDANAYEVCKKALEEVEKLRKENVALKNRCYILTRGSMCLFCPIDCNDRTVKFRGNEDAE